MTDIESQELILIRESLEEGLSILREMRDIIRDELRLRKDDGK